MRNSPGKRDAIVRAAMHIFAERGYEGTSLAMVSDASGFSVGSINNFFDDKLGVAAAVCADAADSLIADIDGVLSGVNLELEATIRAVLSACLNWERKAPTAPLALGLLNGVVSISERYRELEFSTRVASLLAGWAKPLISAGRIAPLSPSQIYCVVLGQVMSMMAIPRAARADLGDGTVDWLHTLVGSTVSALTEWQLKEEPHSVKTAVLTRRRRSSARKAMEGQGTLFGG